MARVAHCVGVTALLIFVSALGGCGGSFRDEGRQGSGGSGGSAGSPQTCEGRYGAVQEGDSYPSEDGCNTCSCTGGQIVCTARDCLDGCFYQGSFYEHFAQFPAGDDCNTCHCLEDGSVSCTMVLCGVCQDLERDYATALADAKSCDPNLANQCSKLVDEGLVCSCGAFVNPEKGEAIATAQALQQEYAGGQCRGNVLCGECAPAQFGYCTLEGRCETIHDMGGGAACKVGGIVYPSGASNIPDPVSCNTCECSDGQLGCTLIGCSMPCPTDSVFGTQCAQCGPADACEVVEHACLPVCTDACESGACVEGVCRSLCG
jgi:hypothetical protein